MRISTKYEVKDWELLSFNSEEDWQKAVDIFEDRVQSQFLNIASAVMDYPFAGFAVVALDCLLIETLQQFREGKERSPKGRSKEFFVRFLTETSFGEYFDREKAGLFYKHIRCGIFHQAEIEGNSEINRDLPQPLSLDEGQKGLSVDIRWFHHTLEKVIGEYVATLRAPGPDSDDARLKFRHKMDYITGVQRTEQEKEKEHAGQL